MKHHHCLDRHTKKWNLISLYFCKIQWKKPTQGHFESPYTVNLFDYLDKWDNITKYIKEMIFVD